ncbi:hypothetical protein ACI2JA_06335 [Alkalihalobacillus sp. NPDC078783]
MSNNIKDEINKIKIPKELSERSIIGISQAKGKFLFYTFLLLFLMINTYAYGAVYYYYIPWKTGLLSTLTTIFVYLLGVIPLTAFLSEKLSSYLLFKVLRDQKSFIIFTTLLILIPIVLFSVKTINENQEKPLDSLFNYHSTNFESMIIEVSSDEVYVTKDATDADEFIDFLSQYSIKKMHDSEWGGDVSKENGVLITFYKNNRDTPIMLSLYETRIHLLVGNYYHVTSTPVDMNHLKERVRSTGNYHRINGSSVDFDEIPDE